MVLLLASALAGVLSMLVSIIAYRRWTRHSPIADESLRGRTVLLVQFDLPLVQQLAKTGARLILASRRFDDHQQKELVQNVRNESKNEDIHLRKLDLSSFQSIREFANEIIQSEKRLDVLINNANNNYNLNDDNRVTYNGFDYQMQINYLGPFLLTNLLLDLLKRSEPSRVIWYTSDLHHLAGADPLNLSGCDRGFPLYCRSRMASLMASNQLAWILKGTKVTSNCMNSGVLNNLTVKWAALLKPFIQLAYITLGKSLDEDAATCVFLAASDHVKNSSGLYFDNCQSRYCSWKSRDQEILDGFWKISKKTVNLN